MSRPDRYRRRFPSGRRRSCKKTTAEESRERLLVELEQQRARAEIELERLQAVREELDDARSRLEAIYRSLPVGYVTLDEEGVITEWNDSAARLLGAKHNGLLGGPLTHFAVHDDEEIVLEHLRQCRRANGGRVAVQLRFKQDPGPALPVELVSQAFHHGQRTFVQTALIDLTGRKQQERDIAEAREFSDALIQAIHEPLLVLDASLKIVRINAAFAELFQVAPQTVRGCLLEATLNLWWTGNKLRRKLEEVLLQDVSLKNFEFEVHPCNIGRRILLFNARRLPQRPDAPPLLLVALEDVTARKEAEHELARKASQSLQLNEELEKRVECCVKELRERNKQLENLCHGMAHDLRGPLRAMAGLSTTLLEDFAPKLGASGVDCAQRIVAATRHLDELIRDLLAYGRVSTMELAIRPVDCEEVLSRVMQNLRAAIEEKRARIERKGNLPRIPCHEFVLETVFSNLLSNALKFVAPKVVPAVTIWPEEQELQVRIWVADNGVGIEPEYHRRIFEIYERLHSQDTYPGTGIGLAIVQRALQRIGGEVGVESAPGKGSRFWFSIPKGPLTDSGFPEVQSPACPPPAM